MSVGAAMLGTSLAVAFGPDSDSPLTHQSLAQFDGRQAISVDQRLAAAALTSEIPTASASPLAGSSPGATATSPVTPTPSASAAASGAAKSTLSATPKRAAKPSVGAKLAVLPAIERQLWVNSAVNVRSGPSPDDDRVGGLKAGDKVGVTGVSRNGWTQVISDGVLGWVKSSFLSTSKPEPQEAEGSSASGVSNARCSKSSSIEPHLSSNARAVYRAVCAVYGNSVSSFGGYRPGDDGDHGSGRAVDIMVSGDPGKTIARYLQDHARELGVAYVIYQQKIWMAGNPTSQWKWMSDRGGATANHYDHVHVSVK